MFAVIRKSKLIRMTLLLTALMLACAVWINRFQYNVAHSYAIAYSLGNGHGFIIYCPNYDSLDPILQESVRVHEERHLQQGSCAFWKHDALEADAYEYQISKLDERIEQFEELRAKTHNHEYARKLELLRDFRRDMVHHMRQHQGLEPPDDSEGD